MVGLCLRKRPNGVGGAGRSVAPPIGAPFGADGDSVCVGDGIGLSGVEVAARDGVRPVTRPMKPPRLSQDLMHKGLFDATIFAAAPKATTAREVVAVIAGAAMIR